MDGTAPDASNKDGGVSKGRFGWIRPRRAQEQAAGRASGHDSASDIDDVVKRPAKWTMGMLNDKETDEVPGSILLLSKVSNRNEPLGLRNAPARTSASSLPSPFPPSRAGSIPSHHRPQTPDDTKKTSDGKIILEPQPEESMNDPLNWPTLRRDAALFSLGFYCMLGGGMTPILAAGFNNVATTFGVSEPRVALTTGLYMLGLGCGSVIASPTAILFGKRPVYLVGSILFILSAVWCALSPNYPSLVVARVFMGIAVSPVECLPSATIAEIFFLHERAYRLGIYTLLLLGGKNLIPLVSAAVIESLGWRWVFWVVAIVVGFGGTLLFLFVPETFWDRAPKPHKHKPHNRPHRPRLSSNMSMASIFRHGHERAQGGTGDAEKALNVDTPSKTSGTLAQRRVNRHAHFSDPNEEKAIEEDSDQQAMPAPETQVEITEEPKHSNGQVSPYPQADVAKPNETLAQTNTVEDPQVAYFVVANSNDDVFSPTPSEPAVESPHLDRNKYTSYYRAAPPKSFGQTLRPYSGRLSHDNWFRVAFRPFILFAYPAILWSSLVYALSVGWLIVLSESVTNIYKSRTTYHFTSLQAGLVYLSPFIGGILGTAVAGKVSDVIVRSISRRNGGIYEPEFRLIMAIPVAITTVIGLMGYGWSAQNRDAWIVPTVFFGIISFGCSLGSTTAITFAVDSYRQYAGEALVTLNFSKNIFHGLVFSLFFNNWLDHDGAKTVFLALGGMQLGFLLFTIPMYIYGKRARMWTVRKNLMEKF
ncbi:hypothetical protein MBLNU459_g6631t1 [Dothideomycetes sp. NU459]